MTFRHYKYYVDSFAPCSSLPSIGSAFPCQETLFSLFTKGDWAWEHGVSNFSIFSVACDIPQSILLTLAFFLILLVFLFSYLLRLLVFLLLILFVVFFL